MRGSLERETMDDMAGVIAQGAPQSFFLEPGMDRFVAVVLNLASELWVIEERLRALEPEAEGNTARPSANEFVERVFAPLRENG